MQLLTFKLEDNHNLFFFGDLHDGSILSCSSGWNELVKILHSKYEGCKNNYACEGGDDIEAICPDDPRFSPEKLTEPLPLVQIKEAVKKRRPIADKLLYKLQGNHERKLWRFGDIMAEICKELDVAYGTYTAKVIIQDARGNLMYKIYDTHGFRNISSTADDPKRRQANLELILKRQLKFKAGDCAVMIKHHAHKLLVCKPESELYLTDDGSEIQQGYTYYEQTGSYIHPDARWYGCAGSFLRLFGEGISGYAEVFEYDPVQLGFLCLIVRDKKIIELRPVHFKL